jgi:beta-mannosidase
MGDMSHSRPSQLEVTDLCCGWSFKQSNNIDSHAWLPVKKVPSTVHQDLIDNNRLKHPFVGFNEAEAEWVGLENWTYKTTIARPSVSPDARVVLAFDGLDTFAHVKLSGRTILRGDNMFLPYRVDVTDIIQSEAHHDLEIDFDSAFLKAREIRDQHPEHNFICFNGDTARLAVRKAQYHWGWDWGPLLMCAGIWKPIRLEVFSARVADLNPDIDISDDHKLATINVSAEIEGHENHDIKALFSIKLGDKTISSADTQVTSEGEATCRLKVENPDLWMPNGYGNQTLYTVSLTIASQGINLHTESKRVGLRKIQLIQEPDRHGKSFFFRVNHVDIFCGGSCWIPTDSFLTNVTPEKYRAWIELMVPANQKMIRYVPNPSQGCPTRKLTQEAGFGEVASTKMTHYTTRVMS